MDLQKKLLALQHWFAEKAKLIRVARDAHDSQILAPKMGDIYFAHLGVNVGFETDKMRPVIVYQGKNRYIQNSQTVFVFPISSKSQDRPYRIPFDQSDVEEGNIRPGTILIQQGRTISTFRLGRKLGRLQSKKLFEVQKCFLNFLHEKTPLAPKQPGGQRFSPLTTNDSIPAHVPENQELNLRSLPNSLSPSERCHERQARIGSFLGADLSAVSIDPETLGSAEESNCENMFGHVPLPVGLAGPLPITFSSGETQNVYLPLATTEGALVASVNRGCKAIAESGGVQMQSEYVGISRSITLKVSRNKNQDPSMSSLIKSREREWKLIGERTSNHLKIINYTIDVSDDYIFVTIYGDTDEAMGMNMITIAAQAIGEWMTEQFDCTFVTVAGNVDSDKKPSKRTKETGRGYQVIAEIDVPEEVIASVLKSDSASLMNVWDAKIKHGSNIAGALGSNLHAANIIAALYLATGQDAAHVVEGSLTDTVVSKIQHAESNIRIQVSCPAIIVGVRGGGTNLPAQKQCLDLVLKPETSLHPCAQLAETIAAAVLAGELSLLAAQASHHLAKAHKNLAR